MFIALLVILIICFGITGVFSQCPMCRMAAETNLDNGGSDGLGLNHGILYMLALPYILIGTISFLWWKNKKKNIEN